MFSLGLFSEKFPQFHNALEVFILIENTQVMSGRLIIMSDLD